MAKKVFIGVGHGGSDSGACANGFKEKNMTLTIAKACNEYLKQYGISTKMSRTKDENDPVNQEVRECNAFNPDLAIDCHVNSGKGDGAEFFYTIGGGTGKTLAKNIENEVKKVGQNSRGIKTRKGSNGRDYYAFIRNTKCAAVICEIGFIDNKNDLKDFDEEHELKAFGVAYAKGILKTLGISIKPNNETSSKDTFLVKVTDSSLNIRASADPDSKITGCIKDKGTYTITETKKSHDGGTWGKLKSEQGWINLYYTKKV